MAKTTISLDEQGINDILELIEWGLTDYPEPNDDKYKRIIGLANRLERAKCRVNGKEWDEFLRWD